MYLRHIKTGDDDQVFILSAQKNPRTQVGAGIPFYIPNHLIFVGKIHAPR